MGRADHRRLGSALRRGAEIWGEGGPRLLFWKVLGQTVFRRMRYFERSLSDAIPPVRPLPGITVEELPPERWGEWQQLHPGTSREEISGRLRRGDRCFIASARGRIVYAGWIAHEIAWCEVLGVEIPLARNAVYFYESFTLPEMRGRGLAPETAKVLLELLRQAGLQSVVAVVDAENHSGLRALEKSGYRPAGWMAVVRLGPWRRLIRWSGSSGAGDVSARADAAYWSRVSLRFGDRDHHIDPFLGRLKRRAHLRLFAGWAPGLAEARILKTDLFEEAGGTDALVPSLVRAGGRVVGMDVSPQVAAQANVRCHGQAPSIAADVRSLPFGSGSFDLVLSPSTLDHFHDPRDLGRSLREMHRVLRPGGRLIVTLDNRQNISDWLLRALSRLGLTPYYLGRSYTIGELRKELESADFEVLDVTGILHAPRLTAVGATTIAWLLNSRRLTRLVHRMLLSAQRLEHTRWAYFTASFVCAYGRPRPRPEPGQADGVAASAGSSAPLAGRR
jgi:SAM-dependent methyltransferase/RimJ/RimL family protein N-acetyltransferase